MSYNCKCIKCNASFTSENESDYDGEAFCPKCIIKNKEIAAKIDEQIINRRKLNANKPRIDSGYDVKEILKTPKGQTYYINK